MGSSDLMSLERQSQIVELVNRAGRMTVAQLSEHFGVSETTIRRDLAPLAARNLVRRTHGGAMRVGSIATSEIPIVQRQKEHAAAKERIGMATAELIRNGETLLVAGGSTGLAVVRHLNHHTGLTIITESLLVVQELLRQGQHHLILLGGAVDPNEQAVRGTLARQMLAQLCVDKVIVGARAVSVTRGVCAETPEEAEFLRAYLECGEHHILVTDSSKFHLSALATLAPLSAINTLVTDTGLDEDIARQIREMGVYLVLIQPDSKSPRMPRKSNSPAPPIKRMVERMIALRQQGIHLTLLAVCPNSEAVLEAAVLAAARNNAPMLFAATLNQVDRDGGYTGWTPAQFVTRLRGYAAKYHCHEALYPCLDHGGQWLKDSHSRQQLTFEETTAEVKASLTEMLKAGYALLHVDPTLDRALGSPLPVDTVVERSLDLIAHAEAERARLGVPPVAYEIGTEEVHGGLVDLDSFRHFLEALQDGLTARGLAHAWPAFVVAQVGTDLHTTRFNRQAAAALYALASPYGSLVKGHYTDWVSNPADYPQEGMGGANIGPEFTAEEYDALRALERREQDLARATPTLELSRFHATLAAAVDASNRWQKWLQPDEQGQPLDALTPDRREWLLKTGARYVWTDPTVVAARQQLYGNLRPIMGDPHRYVVDRIAEAIERYIVAFHLFNARRYFAVEMGE